MIEEQDLLIEATFQSANTNNKYYTTFLKIVETGYDVLNNYSDIYWELSMYSAGPSFGDLTMTSVVTIDGEEVYRASGKKYLSANSTLNIASGTKRVYHNSNGSKTLTCSATTSTSTARTYYPGYSNPSGSLQLTDIPRASILGALQNFVIDKEEYVGNVISVPYTKYFADYKQYLAVSCVIDGILYPAFAERDNFEVDTITFTSEELQTFYNTLKIGNSCEVRFFLNTYTGTSYGSEDYTSIGNNTKNVIASLSDIDLIPSYDETKIIYEVTNTPIAGTIIGGISNLVVSLENSAIAYKGATISKYQVQTTTTDGVKTISNNGEESLVANFEKLTSSSFTIKIFDSRGNQFEKTITLPYQTYSPPTIDSLNIYRENKVGEAIYLSVAGKYSVIPFDEGENNIVKLTCRYSLKNQEEWSDLIEAPFTGIDGQYVLDNQYITALDVTNEYDFIITIHDKLGDVSQTTFVNSADSFAYIDKANKILSIGEIPDPEYSLEKGSINVAGGFYIKGQKLETGGGSTGITRTATTLYENSVLFVSSNRNSTIVLNDDYRNYDELHISLRTDWVNFQNICILKEFYSSSIGYNIVIRQGQDYFSSGRIVLTDKGNEIILYAYSCPGWDGISPWKIVGIKYS